MFKADYLGDSEHAAATSAVIQETVKEFGLCAALPEQPVSRVDGPVVR
jgi:hypothetical protein